VLRLSARNVFLIVNHFPQFHLNVIHNLKVLNPKHFVDLHYNQLLFLVVLRLSARNVFVIVHHFPQFHLSLIHNLKVLNRKHFPGHQLLRFRFRRRFLLLPAMRCPLDAGFSFLVIAVQSFTHGILSVDGDCVPISIARKRITHGSPQNEKKHKTAKQKTQNKKTNGMVGVVGGDCCFILTMRNRGSATPDDRENRSVGSLHSRPLAGTLLSMGHIAMISAAQDFPGARQLRFLARCLNRTNRPAKTSLHDDTNGLLVAILRRVPVITGNRAVQKESGRLIGGGRQLKDVKATLFTGLSSCTWHLPTAALLPISVSSSSQASH
jgi:hypothetical protein